MVGPNKILTVSYGTFSCTLEGFDEPFDTMKAIAEYFRDLASEDRYFGAEPPQPDAEMLHRIAEREIQRRVEARVQDHGVVLRAQIEAEPAPAVRVDLGARPAAAPASPLAAQPTQPLADEAEAASAISERLQRIRAAVARGAAVAPQPAEAEAARLAAERMAAEAAEQARIEAEAEMARIEAERRDFEAAEHARLAAEVEAREQAAEAARLAAEVEAEAARIEAARIEAEAAEEARLVAEAEAEAARIEAARIEAEAAEIAAAEQARLAAEVEAEAARIEAARIEAEAAEQARIEAEEAAEQARRDAEVEVSQAEPEILPAAPEGQPAAEAPRTPRRIVVVRPARPAAAVAPVEAEAAPQPVVTQDWAAQAFQPAPQPPLAEPAELSPAAEAPVHDDPVHDDLADEDDARPVAAQATAQPDADLPDEDEDDAEEQRRWAEAAARIAAAAEAPAAPAAPEPEAQPADERPDAAALAALVESQRQAILREVTGEQAVARLISRTEAQLSDADAQRRLSTISHLKAAVLATRAEQEATGEIPGQAAEAADLARYRADLEREVRGAAADPESDQPRRPVRTVAGRSERPAAAQAPLVLVSEQRIDRPATGETVMPRRVASDPTALDELFDEAAPIRAPLGKAFTDFVAPMQLTTVAEMTEAAAAYITYVTGQEDFARPTVMKLVMSTEAPMTRSRENLLRAFGMLMRQGVLRRSRRGQFELAEDSSFGDKARRFAGH
jgi:hypothetical protein